MGYDKQIYIKVAQIYEHYRSQQQNLLKKKTAEVYDRIPRIEQIDRQLKQTSLMLARKVLDNSGNTREAVDEIKTISLNLNAEKAELLCMNGYPISYLAPQYRCEQCKDTGYIDNVMCRCFRDQLMQEAYNHSNLAAVMETQSFDKFNLEYYSDQIIGKEELPARKNAAKIKDTCEKFAENFSRPEVKSLLMYGSTGLGKTFLSGCIANEILNKGYSVFYQTAYKIFNLMEQHKFSSGDESLAKKSQIDRLFDVDLLIIDDLGSEFSTFYTSTALFNIVNSRLMDKRKTIINTNLNLNELNNMYSARITSRILGEYNILKFYGKDIRTKKG